MAVLNIPDQAISNSNPEAIRAFLSERGIWFTQWEASEPLAIDADQDTVLRAYAHVLEPFMQQNGYQTADVININAGTPNYEAVRNKFLSEHQHTEDEVRFFVFGQGAFWFNLDNLFLSYAAYFFGLIGFWSSLVFYNSYLPDIAFPEQQDKVSARGFSMGYIGSTLLLIINLAMVMFPNTPIDVFAFV